MFPNQIHLKIEDQIWNYRRSYTPKIFHPMTLTWSWHSKCGFLVKEEAIALVSLFGDWRQLIKKRYGNPMKTLKPHKPNLQPIFSTSSLFNLFFSYFPLLTHTHWQPFFSQMTIFFFSLSPTSLVATLSLIYLFFSFFLFYFSFFLVFPFSFVYFPHTHVHISYMSIPCHYCW